MADFKEVFDKILDTEDTTDTYDPADISDTNIICAVGYLLFFIPLIAKPNSEFGKYHANQGLLLLITFFVVSIALHFACKGLNIIPFIGWLAASILEFAVNISMIALFFVGFFNALSGKAKQLPFIGKFKIIK